MSWWESFSDKEISLISEAWSRKPIGPVLEKIKKDRGKAMNTPMRVQYRTVHHDDKPCERKIVIPEGWEICDWHTAERELNEVDPGIVASWSPRDTPLKYGTTKRLFIRPKPPAITLEAGAWYEVEGHGIHQATLSEFGRLLEINGHLYDPMGLPDGRCEGSPRVLRRVWVSEQEPKFEGIARKFKEQVEAFYSEAVSLQDSPQPFRLSGPGWYKTQGGEYWVRLTSLQLCNYYDDGRLKGLCVSEASTLVSKATTEQERVLEGL